MFVVLLVLNLVFYFTVRNIPVQWMLGSVSFVFWLMIVSFFRLPHRKMTYGDTLVIAPADGKVVVIEETEEPEYFKDRRLQISIFMSPANVHVNRNPVTGTVVTKSYRPGKFFNASFDKASTDNERMSMRLRVTGAGGVAEKDIAVVQIAGLVARRIVSETSEGQQLCRGARFGIIRFGSRVDVYLPGAVRVTAKSGQTVRAGETILASYQS